MASNVEAVETLSSESGPRWCCKCWRTGSPPKWFVIGAAILVQVLFGLYPVIVDEFATSTKANPYIFSFYRDAFTFPVLLICTLVAERKLMMPSIKILLVFGLLGLTGLLGGQLLYISAVYILGPDVTSAFQPIIPVWSTILVLLTCTEKPPSPFLLHTWLKLFGILLSVGGAIELSLTGIDREEEDIDILSNDSNGTTGHSSGVHFVGYLCTLGNTLLTALYMVLQKKLIFNRPNCKWRDHPVAVTTGSYFFGTVFMGLSSLYFVATGRTDEFRIPQKSIFALIYAIFINSAVCYLLLSWSNLHLSPSIVTAFWPVQVLVTGIAAYFIVGDEFAPLQYLGAVLLIIGLFSVLFSSYMDERLAKGRKVVRIDGCYRHGDLQACKRLNSFDDYVHVQHPGVSGGGGGRNSDKEGSSDDNDEYKTLIESAAVHYGSRNHVS